MFKRLIRFLKQSLEDSHRPCQVLSTLSGLIDPDRSGSTLNPDSVARPDRVWKENWAVRQLGFDSALLEFAVVGTGMSTFVMIGM